MAVTIELDKYGSTLESGVTTNRYDRGIRRGLVKGLALTDKLDRAIQAAYDQARSEATNALGYPVHPRNITLPLQVIRARRWGPYKVWVWLEYSRRSGAVSAHAPIEIARYASGLYTTNHWFSSTSSLSPTGIPGGPIMFHNCPTANRIGGEPGPRCAPQSWSWVQAAFNIHIPTVLNTHPALAVGNKLNCTNSDTVVFGGLSFAPNTLRFEGMNVRELDTAQGLKFSTLYHFLAVRSGFLQETADQQPPDYIWTFTGGPSQVMVPFNNFPY